MPKKSNIKHLLVIRLSAMGDVAMVPHALRALRENYPDLKISVLTRPLFTPLFDGLNVEIIPIDTKEKHKGTAGIFRLAHEIADMGVDAVADLHSVLRTRMLTSFLRLFHGVKCNTILKGRVSKWMRMDGGCSAVTKALKHTVERYCDVLLRLGFKFEYPDAAVKRDRPNPMPFEKGGERWIGIAPFSVHEGKRYPLHLVRVVVAKLAAQYDRVFIHSGGGDELAFAEELEREYSNVVAVFSKVKLAQEIDLISKLDCLISMDSFAMHMGSLVATPVVSVWGATHPMLGFSGYKCDPRGVVQLDLPCRPCSTYGNKRCRMGDHHCLHDIDPQTVVDRVAELLK